MAMTGSDGKSNGRLAHSLPPVVLNHLQSVVGHAAVMSSAIWEAKSAQQQVFIVSLDPATASSTLCPQNLPSSQWRDALERGCHHVVVRLWIGAARWWNLHCSEFNDEKDDDDDHDHYDGVVTLARAEVAGYRIARTALTCCSNNNNNETEQLGLLEIPQVLYFSHDTKVCQDIEETKKQPPPWAILSYVGPKSAFFHDSSSQKRRKKPTDEWLDGMIPIRREFGFDEPHPRWGRVPVDQCLTLCFHILERFILPLHGYFLSNTEDDNDDATTLDWTQLGKPSGDGNVKPWTYGDMIALYERAHSTMMPKDETQTKIIHVLGQCIQRLGEAHIADMPPVLCHMDCQPQNLVFFRQEEEEGDTHHHYHFPQLHSVLDWEEAAYADPRFELLLLCRKVCANRDQAQVLWDYYTQEIQHLNPTLAVGAMDAWLQLETVHSITTLVLQMSRNPLVGGRNPWETEMDVLGKIEREFHRLKGQGWTFCEGAIITPVTAGEPLSNDCILSLDE